MKSWTVFLGSVVFSASITLFLLLAPHLLLGAPERKLLDAGRMRAEAALAAYRSAPLDLETTEALRILRQAVVLAEDRGFDERPRWIAPLSVAGTARAIRDNVFRGVQTGGSTIPAQLAKIFVGAESRTVRAKLIELALALHLTKTHGKSEILGIYVNLALSLGERDPVGGAESAALALRGKPLRSLSREDALFLACLPRGHRKLRERPTLALTRVLSLKAELEAQGVWDRSRVSHLDQIDLIDPASEIDLMHSWRALVAGGGVDPDLSAALAEGEAELAKVRETLRAGGVETSGGLLLARGDDGFDRPLVSDPTLLTAPVNLASGAKLALLDVTVARLGAEAARSVHIPIGGSVRWWWSSPSPSRRAGLIEPHDAVSRHQLPRADWLSLDEAIAHSVNSSSMHYLVEQLPYLLYDAAPGAVVEDVRRLVPEWPAFALPSEVRLGSERLARVSLGGGSLDVPPEMAAQTAALYAVRLLEESRRARGVTRRTRLPEDPTSVLGNSSREIPGAIARYLGNLFFEAPERCALSDVGNLLASHFTRGTSAPVARLLPRSFGRTAWKSGTSPHDDGMWLGLALCVDGQPMILLSVLRTENRSKLPDQTFAGPTFARVASTFARGLVDRGHRVEGPVPAEDILEEL